MTGRSARRMLLRAGFSCTRARSHEVWEHSDGRTVSLPGAMTKDLYGHLAHKVRRYCEGRRPASQTQRLERRG